MERTGISLARIIAINKHQHLINAHAMFQIMTDRQIACNIAQIEAVLQWYSEMPDKQEKTSSSDFTGSSDSQAVST